MRIDGSYQRKFVPVLKPFLKFDMQSRKLYKLRLISTHYTGIHKIESGGIRKYFQFLFNLLPY